MSYRSTAINSDEKIFLQSAKTYIKFVARRGETKDLCFRIELFTFHKIDSEGWSSEQLAGLNSQRPLSPLTMQLKTEK